ADDHAIVREGLVRLLEREGMEVVGQAADGLEAVRVCRARRPDVAILDLAMPLLNGVDAARQIRKERLGIGIVVLTLHEVERFAHDAMQSGVCGFVVKSKRVDDVIKAIRVVAAGGVFLTTSSSGELVRGSLNGTLDRTRLPLTPRERQVLQLVAE